jgi:heterodisulfide reductase subunit A
VSYDEHGFINEAHPKLRPVETNTAGVYLAGACQAPRDIPESVAMASAAAAKVMGSSPRTSWSASRPWPGQREAGCVGCFACKKVCAYGAPVKTDSEVEIEVEKKLCLSSISESLSQPEVSDAP